jgi:hypothetical protein
VRLILGNQTDWKTAHLRRFILRALRSERPELFTKERSDYHLRCDIEYHDDPEGSSCSGQTHIETGSMWLSVPRDIVDKVDFAIVCFHEAAHGRGLEHDAMKDNPHYERTGNWREIYGWANELPLDKKERQR